MTNILSPSYLCPLSSALCPLLSIIIAGHQYLPGLDTVRRPDDPLFFHHLDDAGSPIVANAQMALDHGNRGLPFLCDQCDGIVISLIVFLLFGRRFIMGGRLGDV